MHYSVYSLVDDKDLTLTFFNDIILFRVLTCVSEPCKTSCSLLAAKSVSDVAYNNFLDHSFLADRKTTIREYLATTGLGIMEEEPPESLKARYGG